VIRPIIIGSQATPCFLIARPSPASLSTLVGELILNIAWRIGCVVQRSLHLKHVLQVLLRATGKALLLGLLLQVLEYQLELL